MVRINILSRTSSGDTLTEVMFATAIAALVIILGVTVMNRGLAQTQLSVESTFVRQAIDAEAELLRYARDEYKKDPGAGTGGAKVWRDIIQNAKTTASAYGTCTLPITGQFFISPDNLNNLTVNTNVQPANTFATIGEGIWVEAVRPSTPITNSDGSVITYLDLHIRACWEPPFNSVDSTLGTIVRLYYEE